MQFEIAINMCAKGATEQLARAGERADIMRARAPGRASVGKECRSASAPSLLGPLRLVLVCEFLEVLVELLEFALEALLLRLVPRDVLLRLGDQALQVALDLGKGTSDEPAPRGGKTQRGHRREKKVGSAGELTESNRAPRREQAPQRCCSHRLGGWRLFRARALSAPPPTDILPTAL